MSTEGQLLSEWDLLDDDLMQTWQASARALLRGGAFSAALSATPAHTLVDPDRLRRLACCAAQAAVDLQVASVPTDLLCAIALQRLIEVTSGERPPSALDEARFLATASGGGTAAAVVAAACGLDPATALRRALALLEVVAAAAPPSALPALWPLHQQLDGFLEDLR